VTDSGRDYDHVPGFDLKIASFFAAQTDRRRTAVYAQNLVTRAVIVVKRVNPVSPRIGPIKIRERLLNLCP
jgi:hypothetical protein